MNSAALDLLLNPRSIAIVGASQREDSIGFRVIQNLRRMKFSGTIYPVNPRYEEVAGLRCFPKLSALPERVDAAFLGVPAAQGPDLLDEAGQSGIRAVFVNAGGYADGDADGKKLQQRLSDIAKRHAIALAGPNNMGLINVADGKAMWTARYMTPIQPGPIAVISQSGSIALALSEDERQLGLAYIVTAGNEAVVTVADYLQAIVRDDRVRVVLMFLETLRDPAGFIAAAHHARKTGKHIIVLKVGSSEGGRAAVSAHTGSLAGDDAVYDAFFRQHGIIRVREIDEMLETAILLSKFSAPPPTPHVVPVTLSGGEAGLLADLGAACGLTYQPLSAATLERLRPAFPPYSSPRNPLDAWGLGFTAERFAAMLDALVADPEIGTLAFCVDAPGKGGGDVPYACVMAEACVAAAARTDKRIVFFNHATGTGPNADVRAILDRAGIPYLSGMRPALAAIAHYNSIGPEATEPPRASPGQAAAWRSALQATDEAAQFAALKAAGVPMIQAVAVASAADAEREAKRLGFPVVLKGTAPNIPHKSDLGLVKLGLKDPNAVTQAYNEVDAILARTLPKGAPRQIVVQRMAGAGLELIVGARSVPGFGSAIVVGLGGMLVEVIKDVSLRLAPVDRATALAMLRETKAGTLLAGFRSKGPYDAEAAADAISALSRVAAATSDTVAAIEINPLIVLETGAVGVDVLIQPANPETS
jgi:acetate---CoA ligase (ADP-forming)